MSTDATRSDTQLTAYVAEEIRALMGRRRINKAEMARRLEVDETWVGRRLNGRHDFALTDIQRIAVVLGVDASDLLPRKPGVSTPIRTRPLEPRIVTTVGQDPRAGSITRRNRPTNRPHRPGRAVSATRPLVPLDRTRVAIPSIR